MFNIYITNLNNSRLIIIIIYNYYYNYLYNYNNNNFPWEQQCTEEKESYTQRGVKF